MIIPLKGHEAVKQFVAAHTRQAEFPGDTVDIEIRDGRVLPANVVPRSGELREESVCFCRVLTRMARTDSVAFDLRLAYTGPTVPIYYRRDKTKGHQVLLPRQWALKPRSPIETMDALWEDRKNVQDQLCRSNSISTRETTLPRYIETRSTPRSPKTFMTFLEQFKQSGFRFTLRSRRKVQRRILYVSDTDYLLCEKARTITSNDGPNSHAFLMMADSTTSKTLNLSTPSLGGIQSLLCGVTSLSNC